MDLMATNIVHNAALIHCVGIPPKVTCFGGETVVLLLVSAGARAAALDNRLRI